MELWTTDEATAKKYQLNTKLVGNDDKCVYTTWILFKDLDWFNAKLNWLEEGEERTITFDCNVEQILKYLKFINTGELKDLEIDDIIALYHQADYHLYEAMKTKLKELSIELKYTAECIKLFAADIIDAEQLVDQLFKTINQPTNPGQILNSMLNNPTLMAEISQISEKLGSTSDDPFQLMQKFIGDLDVNKISSDFNFDDVKPLFAFESVKAVLINRICCLNAEPSIIWNIYKHLSEDEFKPLIEKYQYKVTQVDIDKISKDDDKYPMFVQRLEKLKSAPSYSPCISNSCTPSYGSYCSPCIPNSCAPSYGSYCSNISNSCTPSYGSCSIPKKSKYKCGNYDDCRCDKDTIFKISKR